MAKSGTFANQQKTEEIERDRWIPFLAEFTRENRGAKARLDVMGPDVGYQVETEGRIFEGVSADVKDREANVWIAFTSGPSDHITHGIENVTVIRAMPPSASRGSILEVESRDGTKTVLELTYPEEYGLPPGEEGQSKR